MDIKYGHYVLTSHCKLLVDLNLAVLYRITICIFHGCDGRPPNCRLYGNQMGSYTALVHFTLTLVHDDNVTLDKFTNNFINCIIGRCANKDTGLCRF